MSTSNTLTVDEVFMRIKQQPTEYEKRNATFEQECYSQAYSELQVTHATAWKMASRVAERAQDIKRERRAKGEGL